MNLKDFQRKASRLAGRAAQKGSDLLETGKTKIAIGKEEHAVDELFYKIGEAVYDRCRKNGEVPEDLAVFFIEIEEHRRRIDELKNEVRMEAESSAEEDGEEVIIDITEEPEEEKAEE